MTEALTLTPRRMVAPLTMVVVALALAAAVALGFGIRSWTDDTASSPAKVTPVVQPVTPPAVQTAGSSDTSGSMLRLGKPN